VRRFREILRKRKVKGKERGGGIERRGRREVKDEGPGTDHTLLKGVGGDTGGVGV